MHRISGSTFCQLQKCLHTTSSDFCDFTGLIHFLYLILRRQLLRKGARASSCQSHAEGLLLDALHRGGAVVVRLYYEVAHYVLFTGVKDGQILLFDPYYQTVPFTKPDEKEALLVTDHPFSWNRSVPFSYFNRESMELYALGEMA